MKEYEIVQAGGIVIGIMLVASFYMLLLLGILSSSDLTLHLILITLAIICLAIFTEIYRIGYTIRSWKK